MKKKLSFIAIPVVVLALAFGVFWLMTDPSRGVRLAVSDVSPTGLRYEIVNNSREGILYGICHTSVALYVRNDNEWNEVKLPMQGGRSFHHGIPRFSRSSTHRIMFWGELQPARYRFVHIVQLRDGAGNEEDMNRVTNPKAQYIIKYCAFDYIFGCYFFFAQ
jgi:hypothetical protein